MGIVIGIDVGGSTTKIVGPIRLRLCLERLANTFMIMEFSCPMWNR